VFITEQTRLPEYCTIDMWCRFLETAHELGGDAERPRLSLSNSSNQGGGKRRSVIEKSPSGWCPGPLIPNERAQHSCRFATGRRRSVTGPVTFISRRRCYLGAGDEATHTVHYAAVSFLTLLKKVLERLATSDKTTIAIEKQRDGKMRVTSGSWDGQKIFLKDQVIEVRHTNADGRLHVARKTKRGTTGTRPMSPMTPNSLGGVASDGFIDDCNGVTPERNGVTSDARLYVARKTNHPMSPMTPILRAG
jgi:hypothetical protein